MRYKIITELHLGADKKVFRLYYGQNLLYIDVIYECSKKGVQ